MRPESHSAKTLRSFLREQRIATLPEMKVALATQGTMTVFRKLKQLDYVSSYSHRGQYYTLRTVARFNVHGLWRWESVMFAKYGNLIETACAMVEKAEAGCNANELDALLGVDTKGALLRLHRKGSLRRENIGGQWVYFSPRRKASTRQIHRRRELLQQVPNLVCEEGRVPTGFRAGLMAFFTLLDERQRRLFAGLQSAQLGHGGDKSVAQVLGMDVHTVARGRHEVLAGASFGSRLRQKGAGRKCVKKKAGNHESSGGASWL